MSAEVTCEVRECDFETDEKIEIDGLPLSDSTVVYYYTYGSVLAGLHRPGDDKCVEAMKVFEKVRELYEDNEVIMGIVEASESICAGE